MSNAYGWLGEKPLGREDDAEPSSYAFADIGGIHYQSVAPGEIGTRILMLFQGFKNSTLYHEVYEAGDDTVIMIRLAFDKNVLPLTTCEDLVDYLQHQPEVMAKITVALIDRNVSQEIWPSENLHLP